MTAAVVAPRRQPPDPRLLQRCLLLAVLLHIWLVLVFGNATGTAAPGQGVWGSLTVRLLGRSGSDREAPPAPADQGGAASPTPRTQAAPSTEPAAPAEPPGTATLKLPEGFRPVERQPVSAPQAAAATPLQLPSAELPAAIGRLDNRPDDVTPLPAPARLRPADRPPELATLPADLPAPVNRLDGPPTSAPTSPLPRVSALRPPAAAAADSLPSAELPAPVSRLEATTGAPAAQAALPRAAELRSAPPPAATTLPSTALPQAVQRLGAPSDEAGRVAPLPRAGELRAPAAPTAATALPSGQDLPAPVHRLESADAGTSVAPLPDAARPGRELAAPGASTLRDLSTSLPGQVSAPAATAGPARGDPLAGPAAQPGATVGTPDATPRLGPNVPLPPTAAASAPRPPLNLSLPRGDLAARRGPGLVELLPQPPEHKSKLEQSIEDAANKDCRKAYAGAGLLAVVPLAADAVRGKGCKW